MEQLRTAGVGALLVVMVGGSFLLGMRAKGEGLSTPSRSSSEPPHAAPSASAAPSATAPEFLGVVLALVSADIAPRFQGRLKDVAVRLGDHVAADSVIAVLDVPTLRNDLRVAEATLKTASVEQALAAVELSEAEERLARSTALSAAALASGEDLATARYQQQRTATRVEAARAQLAERQTQVDRLHKENEDAVVRAPFDGIISARYADPGANVTASTPIVRIISARDFIVRFAVPERQIAAVPVGSRARVRVGDRSEILQGTVERIAPEIDAASHMVFVEARLGPVASGGSALSGETVHVSIERAP
jgi:membrane fusion protein (multidrug efflux system)/multidrug efflux system membrane fusion protein